VDPLPGTGYRGPVFMDSDIYKTLEAIGWELAHGRRPELASFAAQVIALLEEAQRPDGYLNSGGVRLPRHRPPRRPWLPRRPQG
jgi:DUF1680 family protein